MDTKLKGDVAEQTAILQALKRGWGVLRPVGDRLAYDLIFDVGGPLLRIQVKSAWFNPKTHNYVVDTRRTKTNRRVMKRAFYAVSDFDFASVYLPALDISSIFPVTAFSNYGSDIQLVEVAKRQRKPTSSQFREAWGMISQWAVVGETRQRYLSNSGKPRAVVIPSQGSANTEQGVET